MNFLLCNLGKRYAIPKKNVKFWWPFFCTKTSWTAMKHVTNEGGGHIWFHHSKIPKRWIPSVLGLSNPADQKRDNKFLKVSRGGGGQWFRNISFTASLYLLWLLLVGEKFFLRVLCPSLFMKEVSRYLRSATMEVWHGWIMSSVCPRRGIYNYLK